MKNKSTLEKEAIADFCHFMLLHSEEGQKHLKRWKDVGNPIDFLKAFQIGYVSKELPLLKKFMKKKKLPSNFLEEMAGKIIIPIRDEKGTIISFCSNFTLYVNDYDGDLLGGRYEYRHKERDY